MGKQPHIAVLMTSYNHAPYVEEQVRSILAQTWDNWDLTISDNGSTDGSWEILKRLEAENPTRIRVVRGPGKFPDNHFSLVANADPSADYFAWCDSDDVWLPNKLEMAMELLEPLGQDEPILYGCQVLIKTGEKSELDKATQLLYLLPPTFGAALEQCLIGGPVSVFNRPARELIALGYGHELPSQDWWAPLIITGAGGRLIRDHRPGMCYRLHTSNLSYRSPGFRSVLGRLQAAIHGRHKRFINMNLAALSTQVDALTLENREKLAAMLDLHGMKGGPLRRIRLLRRVGLCRPSRLETIALYAMVALGLL